MKLVDIYLEPAKVFAAEKDAPTFLLPMALFVAITAAMLLAYFFRVDGAWFVDFTLSSAGREMTAAEIAQAKQFMPEAKTQGYIGAASAAVFVPVMFCVMALYYFLAGKVAGVAMTYRQGLSLATWSAMPGLLGLLVGTIGALTMAPQTPQHSLMLTHVDPLLVQLPFDHALSSLAKNFDLLALWSIALAALGWRQHSRGGWGGAVTVAVLPSVVIYAVWLAFALL